MKLSIIVPVYNAASTIKKCVQSFYVQEIDDKEFEVLLVDDGSLDASVEVIHELQNRYRNISLYVKENGGAASARNVGLDKAMGEFVTFVDSDDYLIPNTLGTIMGLAEGYQSEICLYGMKVMQAEGGFVVGLVNPLKTDTLYSGEDALLAGLLPTSACCIIYSKQFLDNYSIRFRTDLVFGEDTDFSFRTFLKAKRIISTGILGYIYSYNQKSVSKNRENVRQKELTQRLDTLKFMRFVKSQLSESGYSVTFHSYLSDYLSSLSLGFCLSLLRSTSLRTEDVIYLVNRASKENLYPFDTKTKKKKNKLLLALFNVEIVLMFSVKLCNIATLVDRGRIEIKKMLRVLITVLSTNKM